MARLKLKNPVSNLSETSIVNSILEGLTKMRIGSFNRISIAGIFVKTEKGGFYRKPNKFMCSGISDIICCLNDGGIYGAIEVKTEKEFKKVMKFINMLQEKQLIDNNSFINYSPKNKWEEHIVDQYTFILEKRRFGGIGFFTYSLNNCLENIEDALRLKRGV